jgi:hypothetical protein
MKLIAPVQVNVTPAERRRWKAAARRERQSLSDFLRGLVRERLAQGEVRNAKAEAAECTRDATN